MNVNSIKDFQKKVLKDFEKPENWMTFMERSAWYYKQSFYNQLRIVFLAYRKQQQLPPIKAWNHKLNRTVNIGSKRIIIVDL